MVKTFYVDEEHHQMVLDMAKYDDRSFKATVERAIEAAFKAHPLGNVLPHPDGAQPVPVITAADWHKAE
jgi:hypothetical protein